MQITREVASRKKLYEAWVALQGRPVKHGSAGEYIGHKTILAIAGNSLTLISRPRTSRSDFEKEARQLHFA